jgi:heme exporter protein D
MAPDKYAVFIWPAYAVSALGFVWMTLDTLGRARRWRRKTEALEEEARTEPPRDAAPERRP